MPSGSSCTGQWPALHQSPHLLFNRARSSTAAGFDQRNIFLLAGMSPGAAAPEDRWLHHLRRKERATAGSVEKMATGMARSLVGRFSGRFAMT